MINMLSLYCTQFNLKAIVNGFLVNLRLCTNPDVSSKSLEKDRHFSAVLQSNQWLSLWGDRGQSTPSRSLGTEWLILEKIEEYIKKITMKELRDDKLRKVVELGNWMRLARLENWIFS